MSQAPATPTSDTAAPRALPQRIAPLIEGLTERIEQNAQRIAIVSDTEAVHDFRVAIRRLRSVLATTRKLYDKRRIDKLTKELKDFASGCGQLRDEEVLGETLARADLDEATREQVSSWLDSRRSHEATMRQAAATLAGSTQIASCLTSIRELTSPDAETCAKAPTLERFTRKQLRKARARIERLLPAESSDGEGLHRLRIAFKRLRYTADILRELANSPPETLTTSADAQETKAIARQAKVMQDELGIVHDIDQAMLTLSAAETIDEQSRQLTLDALQELRGSVAEQAVRSLSGFA